MTVLARVTGPGGASTGRCSPPLWSFCPQSCNNMCKNTRAFDWRLLYNGPVRLFCRNKRKRIKHLQVFWVHSCLCGLYTRMLPGMAVKSVRA